MSKKIVLISFIIKKKGVPKKLEKKMKRGIQKVFYLKGRNTKWYTQVNQGKKIDIKEIDWYVSNQRID